MKRVTSVMVAMVLAGSVAVAMGAPGGGGGAGGGGGGRGAGQFGGRGGGMGAMGMYQNQYDQMVQQVGLSEEQKPKVKEKVDAMNKEIEAFQQNLQGQAGGGGGGMGRGGMMGEMDKLQALIDEHQLKIDQELTEGQRETWETFRLNRTLTPRLNQLGLTSEQQEKAKGIIDEGGKAMAKVTEAKQFQTEEGKVVRKLVADVLTDEQAAKLMRGPAGGRGGFGGGGFGGGQGGQGGGRGQGGAGRGGRGGAGGPGGQP